MSQNSHQLRSVVRAAASDAGFDICGMVNVRELHSQELEYFPSWIAGGNAGEMKYLEARNENGDFKRASLQNALPWARSVIICALNYNTGGERSVDVAHEKSRGWISRYAWGRKDYHDVLLGKLRQVEGVLHRHIADEDGRAPLQTKCYVDTGPFLERVYARYAGLGWVGKNTCLINQQLGSWLFLGAIATSIEFRNGSLEAPPADRCGSCTRCLDACPTQAFIAPYQLDARKCISYLTIEKRGSIPEDLRPQMGNHLFGCDICQDVCPWNRKAPASTEADFQPKTELMNPPLEQIAELIQRQFQEVFRHSPVKRAKYSGLRRNAAVAMGNSGDPKFVPRLQQMAVDEDGNVAEHARWALEQIAKPALAEEVSLREKS
jgi:epoxyqueuosine reductase